MHRQLRSCAAMEVDQSPLAMDLRAFSSTCQAVLGAATAMAMEDDDDDTAAVRAMEDEMHEEETYARKGKGAPGVSHPIAQIHVLLARRVAQKTLPPSSYWSPLAVQWERAKLRRDAWASSIGRELIEASAAFNSDTGLTERAAKKFRLRYRLPYSVFCVLVEEANRMPSIERRARHKGGRKPAPVEILVAASLRHLGKGHDFDDTLEFDTDIGSTTLLGFHHLFMEHLGGTKSTFYNTHVFIPLEGSDEFEAAAKTFELLGLPGCVASVDGVHVGWERAPMKARSWQASSSYCNGLAVPSSYCSDLAVPSSYCSDLAVPLILLQRPSSTPHPIATPTRRYVGKSGCPTLNFDVAGSHDGRIWHVAGPHPGARNDKTVVKFDKFVQDVHHGRKFAGHKWMYREAETGIWKQQTGAYLICDGGYHRWRCLQCPLRFEQELKAVSWNKWVEGVRKDIECIFGRLKGRWRCCRVGSLWQEQDRVSNQFRACCALQNLLHDHDGMGAGVRWETELENMATTIPTFTKDPAAHNRSGGDSYEAEFDTEKWDEDEVEELRRRYRKRAEYEGGCAAELVIDEEFDASGVGWSDERLAVPCA